MEWAATIGGAAGIVLAMIQVLKRSSLGKRVPSGDWGLVAIVLGVGWTFLLSRVGSSDVAGASPASLLALGIIAGLTASGAYGTGKSQMEEHWRGRPVATGEQ